VTSTVNPSDTTNDLPVRLLAIFLVFFRIGAFSFGGGLTGWVYREVVQQRKWMTESDFLSGLAVGQILPGANIINIAMYVGNRLRGTIGAFTAFLGILLAPFFCVIGLYLVYDRISDISWVSIGTDGIAAAAIGLLMLTAWRSGMQTGRSVPGFAALAITFVTVSLLRWPLIPVVLCVAPVSILAAWYREKRRAR
jgi:chromate transporter